MGCMNTKEDQIVSKHRSISRGTSSMQHLTCQKPIDVSTSRRDLFSIFGNELECRTPSTSCDSLNDLCAPPTQTYVSLNICYGFDSNIGIRDVNEDRHTVAHSKIHGTDIGYFSIYDGHGGTAVAEYLAQHLHTRVFHHLENYTLRESIEYSCADIDNQIYETHCESGSTAILMTIRGKEVVFASIGDSQAVLSTDGIARDLCVIHKPSLDSERERIVASNGVVIDGRIFGMLGVSRAFGDNDFKTSKGDFSQKFTGDLVSAKPDIVTHRVQEDDEFVILGCDGLFDVMTPQQAVHFVRNQFSHDGNVQPAVEALVKHALKLGSVDNVSCFIVCFQHHTMAAVSAVQVTLD